jgi:hypothetical protein
MWDIKENLFDRGMPLHQYFKMMRRHVENAWEDPRRTERFLRGYKTVVWRAIELLQPRIIEWERQNEQTRKQRGVDLSEERWPMGLGD